MIPLYSWPTHRDPLPLSVTGLTVDGDARDDLVDGAHERLRLDRLEQWQAATVAVATEISTGGEVGPPDTVHVLVSSPRTRTRLPVPLANTGDGAWVGEVRVPRALVAGVPTLAVEVAGTIQGRTRLLGRSDEWSLVVDAGEQPVAPGGPPFPMKWVRFDSARAPEAARLSPDVPALMDLTGRPTLYLNDAVPGLRALLHADTARGERRRIRDYVGAEVARIATTALVRAAVEDVVANADGDEVPLPVAHAQREALAAVARSMRSVSDVQELCGRIVRAAGGPLGDLVALWSEMDAAIARLCGSTEAVAAAVKEARNG